MEKFSNCISVPLRHQSHDIDVVLVSLFIVNFEQISNIFLVTYMLLCVFINMIRACRFTLTRVHDMIITYS